MICLSFDTEEFDVPCEYGVEYDTIKEGMLVSQHGIERILQMPDSDRVGRHRCYARQGSS